MLNKIMCKVLGHKWRRPHNGESADKRYCTRCPETRPVRKRKAKG